VFCSIFMSQVLTLHACCLLLQFLVALGAVLGIVTGVLVSLVPPLHLMAQRAHPGHLECTCKSQWQ
jgi:hypothetical protein